MDLKKILVLLVAFIIYINYENYFKTDVSKLKREVNSLTSKIEQEKKLQENNSTKENLSLKYDVYIFDGKKYSYSQAMGELQNEITLSAKDVCTTKSIKWAQAASSKLWYDNLRMDVLLECKPKEMLIFVNNLREKKKLYNLENFRIISNKRKNTLNVNFQLVAYRSKK